jgi:undecaprenyl-diphosphatase
MPRHRNGCDAGLIARPFILIGSIASFVSAYLAVRFLTRYFETRTLTPFAIYCVIAGVGSLLWLTLR